MDFNQGLDLRLMDKDIAKRIRELRRMTTWRFAFDSLDYTDEVIDGIRMLQDAGVKVRSSSLTYVYMDSDDDFDSALERLRILRGLDAMPYIMLNRNSRITPRMCALKRWTRPQIFYSTEWEDYDVSVRGHNADRNQERRDDRTRRPHSRIRRHRPRSDGRLHPRGHMHARGHRRRHLCMARRHRMGVDGGIMLQPLTPIEEEVVSHLRHHPMTIRQIERAMGRDCHDRDVAKALDRLKWLGYIRRKHMSGTHLVVWELM